MDRNLKRDSLLWGVHIVSLSVFDHRDTFCLLNLRTQPDTEGKEDEVAGQTGVFSVMSRAEPEPDLDQTHRSFAPANYARLQTALARQRGTAKEERGR